MSDVLDELKQLRGGIHKRAAEEIERLRKNAKDVDEVKNLARDLYRHSESMFKRVSEATDTQPFRTAIKKAQQLLEKQWVTRDDAEEIRWVLAHLVQHADATYKRLVEPTDTKPFKTALFKAKEFLEKA